MKTPEQLVARHVALIQARVRRGLSAERRAGLAVASARALRLSDPDLGYIEGWRADLILAAHLRLGGRS